LPNLNLLNTSLPGELTDSPLQPPAAQLTIPRAVNWSGFSRSALYRYNAAGLLIFRKSGRTVLVDGASLAALIASLPETRTGAPKSAA
jgi:hypothetical protein